MNDLEKLKHLIGHWTEHNREHARTYSEWARKADDLKKPDIAGILREVAGKTEELNTLLEEALSHTKPGME